MDASSLYLGTFRLSERNSSLMATIANAEFPIIQKLAWGPGKKGGKSFQSAKM